LTRVTRIPESAAARSFAAHGENMPAEWCESREVGGGQRDHDQYPDSDRQAKQPPGAKEPVAGCAELLLADQIGECSAVRQQERGATSDVKRAKGRDERGDVQLRDQRAVYGAEQKSHSHVITMTSKR
jgi:hypothetical protein